MVCGRIKQIEIEIVLILSPLILIAYLLCLPSCSRTDENGEQTKLDHAVFGFYPGETKRELFKRARGTATWEKLPGSKRDYRGELWKFSGPLDGSAGIDHVRLAFLDGRLLEIIVYFTETSASKLEVLKGDLESQYQTQAATPDGTKETTYKTYRLPGPGISITLRRITKLTETELYIQYLHDELHRRLIARKKEER
jgi:hypothetical protein